MKRILVVDDDPLVFEGLRRILAPQKGQWEMAFAPEGKTALALLAATPFDVVVSDLYMPRMDGAALLKTVRERWPGWCASFFPARPTWRMRCAPRRWRINVC